MFAVSLSVLLLSPRTVHAEPQANAGILAGVGGRGTPGQLWDRTVFYGGLRGDVLFGQSKPRDFGIGPFAQVTTAAFDDMRLGGGATAYIPMSEAVPLLLSTGGFGRYASDGWTPGVTGQLFFGSRSFNYGSAYALTTGLVLGVDHMVTGSRETTFVLAAQLDAFLLAAPFILLRGALRNSD